MLMSQPLCPIVLPIAISPPAPVCVAEQAQNKRDIVRFAARLAVALFAAMMVVLSTVSGAFASSRDYPETGQVLSDPFLTFFDTYGGIEIFGLPRTGEFIMNGRRVQYFQRVRMEIDPAAPDQVQIGALPVELGRGRPPSIQSSDPNRRYFRETQHSIGGAFRDFWETRGGPGIFGYPITDEVNEKGFIVQYFERARIEYHGEFPADHRVALGLVGDEALLLGVVPVPPDAGPKVPIGGPLPISPAAAGRGRILFSTGIGGDFYLMDPTGANVIRIGRGIDPSISPDGTQVVYAQWEGNNPGLYVFNLFSGGKPTLVYPSRDARGAVFSPKMDEIAFYEKYRCYRSVPGRRPEDDDCFRVKVIPAGGGQDWLIPGQSPYATSPSWNSDGKSLIFRDEKWISIASRAFNTRKLTPFEPRYWSPALSPAGDRIAVEFDQNREVRQLGLIRTDGSNTFSPLTMRQPLDDFQPTYLSPAWSPDGTRIAFASSRDGALRIWTMNADGTDPVRINDIVLQAEDARERFVSWGASGDGVPIEIVRPPTPVPTPDVPFVPTFRRVLPG